MPLGPQLAESDNMLPERVAVFDWQICENALSRAAARREALPNNFAG